MDNTRFESKYRLSAQAYYRVVNLLLPSVRLDTYSSLGNLNHYPVRSLYFDTADYATYCEKVEGVYRRHKFRIRTYEKLRDKCNFLKVEKKSRYGNLIHKTSDVVSLDEYDSFMLHGHWGDGEGETLDGFRYEYYGQNLRPTTIVQYDREAYTSCAGDDARFSFDHNIQYMWNSDLFADEKYFISEMSGSIIFEIKVSDSDFDWVTDFVKEAGLVAEPNSKYVNSFDHSATDIWL
jgi:hypothetical protein